MRRKDTTPLTHSSSRGRSLISTRTLQQQQRKVQSSKSLLPRSYSSPGAQNDSDCSIPQTQRGPKAHGSRIEFDSDLENFEQFEECFVDIDADQEEGLLTQYRSSPERDEPKKVMTTILPDTCRLNFRPLVLKMPVAREPSSPGIEELQSSPQLELEAAELDRELDNAEQHLNKAVAIATEESDADTLRDDGYEYDTCALVLSASRARR
ncbi:unnamed protein product [Arctia plantaginis]|uniref:Uncharacterized protein n=1 Tax=Arctia plantaginis TaxID=874455 RepID=A0A8S0YXA2_ARCPL|nr:unnamed protein product [Arctia plantaginis]